MTKWIKVTDDLPDPFEPVWIYWRDREVLIGCHCYDGEERIKCDPSEGWYSYEDEKCKWTHWWHPLKGHENMDKPDIPIFCHLPTGIIEFGKKEFLGNKEPLQSCLVFRRFGKLVNIQEGTE